jgi:hypothetical protein
MIKSRYKVLFSALILMVIYLGNADAFVLYESTQLNTNGGVINATAWPTLNDGLILVDDITVPSSGWTIDTISNFFSSMTSTPTVDSAYLIVFLKSLGQINPLDYATEVPVTVDTESFTDSVTGQSRETYRIEASGLNLTLASGDYWIGLAPISDSYLNSWMAWGSRIQFGERPIYYDELAGAWTTLPVFWSGPDEMIRIKGSGGVTYDYSVTAPGSWNGTTCGAGDDCSLRQSPDIIYEITIPFEGAWTFSLCNSPETWNSFIYLGNAPCLNIAANDDYCEIAGRSSIRAGIPAGTYYLTIEGFNIDDCGSFTLDVTGVPPAPNDRCENVTPQLLTEGSPLTLTGTTIGATSINDCASFTLYPAVWEAFTINHWMQVTLDYCGTTPYFQNSYAALAVNCPCDSITENASTNTITCGDNNITMVWDRLAPGTYYYPVMNDPDHYSNGPYTIHVSGIVVPDPPEIGINPASISGTAVVGESDIQNLSVSNLGGLDLSGTASVHITGLLRQPTPINPNLPHAQNVTVTRKDDINKPHSNGNTPPANPNTILQGGDNIATATPITSLPFSDSGTTIGYSYDYDAPCGYNNGAPDVVYSYAPTVNGYVDISLCANSAYDTKLWVIDQDSNAIACNEDFCATPSFSDPWVSNLMRIEVTVGNTYYIIIGGYDATCSGNYTIDVTSAEPPPQCSGDALYGTPPPKMPTSNWSFVNSDSSFGYIAAESFDGASGYITSVKWWGLDYTTSYTDCDYPDSEQFNITFCRLVGGIPADTVAYFPAVFAAVSSTGLEFGSLGYEKEFNVTLPTPVYLYSGVLMIEGRDPSGCALLWASCASGSSFGYDIVGATWWQNFVDLAFCLGGDYIAPWLTINGGSTSTDFTVAPGGNQVLPIEMSAANLTAGTYHGNVHITSNDLYTPSTDVPVTFTVTGGNVCDYLIGDISGDGSRLGGDVTYGVRYFKGTGSAPKDSCYMDSTHTYIYVAGDCNGNCEFRGSDITRLVAYFKGTAHLSCCHFFPTTLPPYLRNNNMISPKLSGEN